MKKTGPTVLVGTALLVVAMGLQAKPGLRAQEPADDAGARLLRVLHEPLARPAALSAPSGIALAPDGRVAVLTANVGTGMDMVPRVAHFDAEGQLYDLWLLETDEPLQDPWDLEFASDGSLLVGSRGFVDRWRDGARVERWPLPKGQNQNGRTFDRIPYRIRVHPAGDVYVSAGSGEHSRIYRYSSDGRLLGEMGEGGSGEAQFDQPAGFTFDERGHLYVADTRNHRIQHYDSEGNWLGNWGGMGTEPGQFNQPTDIRKPAEGFLVVDRLNHRLQWFDEDGTFLATSSGQGAAPGGFDAVWEAEVAPDGTILALDTGNDRVLKLDEAGASTLAIGEPHQPSLVSDLALNDAGELVLADTNRAQVLRLSDQGAYQSAFGEPGTEAHQFRPMPFPARLQLDPDGSLWLAGMQLSRQEFSESYGLVQHFDASGTYLGSFDGAAEGVPAFGQIRDMRLATGGAAGGEDVTLWVLDERAPHLRHYAPDGSLLRAFGSEGTQPGFLTRPAGLALLPAPGATDAGEIEVLVSDLHGWQRFGLDGGLRDAIRHEWPEECAPGVGNSPVPHQLRQTAHGLLTAHDGEEIRSYAPDGRLLRALRQGLRFPHYGELSATDAVGRLYLADRYGRIEVFEAPDAGEAPATWLAAWYDNAWLADWPLRAGTLQGAEPDALELDWPEGQAPEGLEDGRWAARFSRVLALDEGDTWSFDLSARGGARLVVDGEVVADAWRGASLEASGELELRAGTHLFEIELRDSAAAASLTLELVALGRPPRTLTPTPIATDPPSPTATPLPPTPTPVPPSTPWSLRMPYRIHLPFIQLMGQGSSVEPASPWTTAGEVDVSNYDLQWIVSELDGGVEARVSITLEALERLSVLRLDAEPAAMEIISVEVDGQRRPWLIESGMANDYGLTGSELVVGLAEALEPGEAARVGIRYRILAESLSGDKGLMLATDFQRIPTLITRNFPYYTRFYLPSHDHPSDPATFDIELHVPADMVGAAIGKLVDGSYAEGSGLDAEGLRIFRFAQESPSPTYGLNIAIGPFLVESGELCYDPQARDALPLDCSEPEASDPILWVGYGLSDVSYGKPDMALAGRALIHHAQHFGAYPFAKLGLVTAPHPYSNASPSLITIVGNHNTVHEVAHSWWGNGVQHYAAGWGEGWLSEGLSNYSDVLYKELVEHEVARADCNCRGGSLLGPVDVDPWAYYGGTGRTGSLYCGGQAAFHDLRSRFAAVMGQPVWAEGPRNVWIGLLARYYRSAQGKPAGSEVLLEVMKQYLRREMEQEGVDLLPKDAIELVETWAADWVY